MADTEFGANLRRLTEVAKGRGLEPVLVLLRDKAAFQKGWPELRPSASRALAHVRKDPKRNAVGIQPASLGCVVLDCDQGEGPQVAAEAIRDFLGDVIACVTPSTSGAKNKGHVWVRCDDPYAVGNWKFRVEDPIEGEASGDFRSTGQVRLNDHSVGMILENVLGDTTGESASAKDLATYRTSVAAEIDRVFERSEGREATDADIEALASRLDGPDDGPRFEHLFALTADLKAAGISFDAALELLSEHAPLWVSADGEDDGKFAGAELERHLELAWAKHPKYVHPADEFDDLPLSGGVEDAAIGETGPLERMNRRYAAVDVEGKFRVAYKQTEEDPWDGTCSTRWIFATKQSFLDYHQNRKMESLSAKGKPTIVPVAEEWLKWSKRTTKRGLVFSPNRDVPGFLNLWTGFGCGAIAGETDMIHWMIRDSLCDGDAEAYHFVLDWLAYGVQHPEELIGVALAFHGAKGTGKTTLGELMVSIYGMHGLALSSRDQLTGKFNGHMGTCCLAFCDEIDFHFASGREDSALKKVVTDKYGMMEKKGVDATAMHNRTNVLISGNSDHSVPASADERRYAVIEVADTWGTGSAAPNLEEARWLHGLVHQQIRGGGREAFLKELLDRRIERHPRETIPQNGALVQQKVHGLSMVQRWFFEACEDGQLPMPDIWMDFDNENCWEIEDQWTTPQAVVEDMDVWRRSSEKFRRKQMPSHRAILKELRALGVAGGGGMKHQQLRAWKVPALPEVRRSWERLLGGNPFAD